MKVGDIVYICKSSEAKYCCSGGSYIYYFVVGHQYKITYKHGDNLSMTNITTGDGVSHYFYRMNEICTQQEWRHQQLNDLLKDESNMC